MVESVAGFARRLGAGMLLVNAAPDAVGLYDATGWHRFAWAESELVGLAEHCVQMRKVLPT